MRQVVACKKGPRWCRAGRGARARCAEKRTADKDFVAIVAGDSSGLRELTVARPMLSEAELESRRRADVEGADAVVGLVDDEEALRRAVKGEPVRPSQLTFARTLAAKAAKHALAGRWGTRGRESAPRPIRRLWQAAEADRAVVALGHPAAAALVAGDSSREEEVVPLTRVRMRCMRMRIHIRKRHTVHGVAQRVRDDELAVTQCKVRRAI